MRPDGIYDTTGRWLAPPQAPPVARDTQTPWPSLWRARDAGWRAYAFITIGHRTYEVISMPYPREDATVACLIRELDDPTTMVEVTVLS